MIVSQAMYSLWITPRVFQHMRRLGGGTALTVFLSRSHNEIVMFHPQLLRIGVHPSTIKDSIFTRCFNRTNMLFVDSIT